MRENHTLEEHVVTEYEEESRWGGEKGRMRATRDTMFQSTIVSG